MSQQNRFLAALNRQAVDSTPIWFMRQAGRYLPEYRAIRRQAGDFLTMCKTPEIAAEVTLQPLKRFDLDAAIIFSDILTIPEAMGLPLAFKAGEGPIFSEPVQSEKAVAQLSIPEPQQDLAYVPAAIRAVKEALPSHIPLIGFCGSPWTVATYMVEGKSSKTFSVIKKMLYGAPETLRLLLDKLVKASIDYLTAQVNAGANALMIFDTWGGILSPLAYQTFSLSPMQEIVTALKANPLTASVPIILFTKQAGQHLELLANTGCQGVGVDWTVDLQSAKARIGQQVALQGNLDPSVLYADRAQIQAQVRAIMEVYAGDSGHIFNLGHGIYPDIDPDNVQVVIETVREFCQQQRKAS